MSDPSTQPAPDPPQLQQQTLMQALGEVFKIAMPTVMTMTSYTVMQFVDKLMVGQVGPLELTAQGNGGIWAFTPIAIAMGFLTVVNTFVSQHLGAGKPREGSRYAWCAIWIGLAVWVTVFIPLIFIAPWGFSKLNDPAVIENYDRLLQLETTYAQILLGGALITMLSRGMHHYFFGLHKPMVVTIAAISGNLTNIIANYILIFGEAGLERLGLPGIPGTQAYGLTGAAIGTVLGTSVELIIPLIVFLGPKMHKEFGTRSAWRPRWDTVRDLYRLGWPAAMQYGNELLCWSIFMSVLVGRFGEAHMAAGWIALGYIHLSFMPAVGFSVAATSLVGKYIGAGSPDLAVSRARLCLGMSVVYMSICGVIFFIWREELVSFFIGDQTPPEEKAAIVAIGSKVMICAALFQTLDAVGIVYSGALRGAGDTVWPGVMTMVYAWLFIVGGGWALAEYMPQWESLGPWIGAAAYLVSLGVTMSWRFESGRWRSIDLLGSSMEKDASRKAPLGPAPPSTIPDGSVRDIAEEMVDD